MKILHVCSLDKFIPPYIQFVRKNFTVNQHSFFLRGDDKTYPYEVDDAIYHGKKKKDLIYLLRQMIKADKIILHGLFDPYVILLLSLNPYLLKKCYWVMWGGDLYSYMYEPVNIKQKIIDKCRRFIIKRIGYLLTYIPGDIEIARNEYGAKGKYLETIGYLSNIYQSHKNTESTTILNSSINILVGNSADPSNRHFEIFDILTKHKEQNIKLYTPLSYGDQDHASKVIKKGQTIFGDKFVPLTNFLPKNEYTELLNNIDIAIFNHARQQAMGNTINLLGMNKTVYLREGTSQWHFLKSLDLEIHDINKFSIKNDFSLTSKNNTIISNYFSYKNLLTQWDNIFKG